MISLTMVSCATSRDITVTSANRIDRIALGHQMRDALRRVALQHRPIGGGAAFDPPHQHLEIGLEPDRNAVLRDARAGVGVHVGAAAGREHLRAAVEQARDHALLAGAEIRLAMVGEDFRDGHAGGATRSRRPHPRTDRPRRCASRRPIEDLPAPIMPTSTIERRPSAAIRAVTSSCGRGAGFCAALSPIDVPKFRFGRECGCLAIKRYTAATRPLPVPVERGG